MAVFGSRGLIVEASSFVNNSAWEGGGLHATDLNVDSAPLPTSSSKQRTITSSLFSRNSAQQLGGAITLRHTSQPFYFTDTNITSNSATGISACPQSDSTCAGAGGGLAVFYARIFFEGGHIEQNTAITLTEFSPRGGGLFGFFDNHDLAGGSGNIGMFNFTTFSGNKAQGRDVGAGGGGWINGGVTFHDCTFTGNTVSSTTLNSLEYNSGGGIYVQRSAQDSQDETGAVVIRGCNFTRNHVESGGYGGAVFAKGR